MAALQRDRDALGPEAACAILRTYLAQLPADLAALDESLAAGDVAAIRKRAHRLRGGAGNFDLTGLCALTRRIEAEAGRNGAALREALKQAGAAAVQELPAAANSLGLAL
ncbi:MAG TPA: Hpt domain-containing protein [Aestuariivirga sp.]|nr:Hpt domain-containing protein [Aestuariivirga sp.]